MTCRLWSHYVLAQDTNRGKPVARGKERRTVNSNRTIAILSFTILLYASAVTAQQTREHAEKLGTVHFPTSCTLAVQPRFERAVALLHSFWYEETVKAFTDITTADPSCAMGYWGLAMSIYYPLWYPPSEATLKKGLAIIERAKVLGGKTEREKDYIEALGGFYKDSDKLDHRTRALAYERAMERVHVRYPDDREAAVFYALALNATALPTDKTYANQLKAAAILEKVFAAQSDHPGVAHYLIHSYDYPPLAQRALPAARYYAKIAPSAPHALHMPAHIFTRLGLWQQSIDSNRASADSGKRYFANGGRDAVWDQTLHAMDYLVYAYLQGARDREARGVVDELMAMRKAEPESLPAAYALAAIPARLALERRQWADAASLAAPPMTFPWNRFPWGEAITSFARAAGAARIVDIAGARKEVDKLALLRDALATAKNQYWADQVEIQRRAAAGLLARAQGSDQEALGLLRSAADLESSMGKHPVTPAPVVPARELLGELLLELNQAGPARQEFEATLAAEPNRFRSLFGAARAAEISGDAGKARAFYATLVTLCERADTERPELKHARAYLAK